MWNWLVCAIGGVFAALLLVGCGGDSELTIEEYFEQLQQINDDRHRTIDESEAAFDEVLEDEDSDEDDFVKAFQDFVKGNTDAMKDALDDADGLTPPEEIAAVHDDFIATLRTFVNVLEDFREELDDIDSQEELFTLLETTDALETAEGEFATACKAVQQAATDNGITVEIDCPGEDDE